MESKVGGHTTKFDVIKLFARTSIAVATAYLRGNEYIITWVQSEGLPNICVRTPYRSTGKWVWTVASPQA